ncbi:MAG: cytochrome d ubiquinol oxidase subunit II [Candidatus Kapaibacterium sp.]
MYEGLDLNLIWFILVGILLTGYAILDGFDLGVGALHLFVKDDSDRRIMINSIGPVWDGNEVWLVTGGGAIFAAFPDVYATVFSAFYPAIMLILVGIIFRAVAIEFRSKNESKRWRKSWDIAFSFSSILIALLFGTALGNIIQGIPVNSEKEAYIGFFSLINPYAILVGITTVALFMMHGAIYAVMKTEGKLQSQVRGWVNNTIIFFVICYVTVTMATLIYLPHMTAVFKAHPEFFILALLNMLAVANIPREIHKGREFAAFFSSSFSIAALLGLFALGMFPNFVTSSIAAAYSLNAYAHSSSKKTLEVMLTMALIGIPFVLAYTASIYWVFRGKVKLDKMSY